MKIRYFLLFTISLIAIPIVSFGSRPAKSNFTDFKTTFENYRDVQNVFEVDPVLLKDTGSELVRVFKDLAIADKLKASKFMKKQNFDIEQLKAEIQPKKTPTPSLAKATKGMPKGKKAFKAEPKRPKTVTKTITLDEFEQQTAAQEARSEQIALQKVAMQQEAETLLDWLDGLISQASPLSKDVQDAAHRFTSNAIFGQLEPEFSLYNKQITEKLLQMQGVAKAPAALPVEPAPAAPVAARAASVSEQEEAKAGNDRALQQFEEYVRTFDAQQAAQAEEAKKTSVVPAVVPAAKEDLFSALLSAHQNYQEAANNGTGVAKAGIELLEAYDSLPADMLKQADDYLKDEHFDIERLRAQIPAAAVKAQPTAPQTVAGTAVVKAHPVKVSGIAPAAAVSEEEAKAAKLEAELIELVRKIEAKDAAQEEAAKKTSEVPAGAPAAPVAAPLKRYGPSLIGLGDYPEPSDADIAYSAAFYKELVARAKSATKVPAVPVTAPAAKGAAKEDLFSALLSAHQNYQEAANSGASVAKAGIELVGAYDSLPVDMRKQADDYLKDEHFDIERLRLQIPAAAVKAQPPVARPEQSSTTQSTAQLIKEYQAEVAEARKRAEEQERREAAHRVSEPPRLGPLMPLMPAPIAKTAPPKMVVKAPSAAKAPKSNTVTLRARQEGDRIHTWDCGYEAINNAAYIYNDLIRNGRVNEKGLANAPYGDWIPTAQEAFEALLAGGEQQMCNPDAQRLKQILREHLKELIPVTFVDQYYNLKNTNRDIQSGNLPVPTFDIGQLRTHDPAVHAFIINGGGHWFTVVVHRVGNTYTYYIADDRPGKMADHDEAVNLLRKAIER